MIRELDSGLLVPYEAGREIRIPKHEMQLDRSRDIVKEQELAGGTAYQDSAAVDGSDDTRIGVSTESKEQKVQREASGRGGQIRGQGGELLDKVCRSTQRHGMLMMIFSIITIVVVTSFMKRQGNPVLLPVEHDYHDPLTE